MKDGLLTWQSRLEAHFAGLCKQRLVGKPGHPIYALEHGLSISELNELAELLRSHIKSRRPSRDHALPWIVYAAEIGYEFFGNEYWQTFERRTPGWLEHGERGWIRRCFYSFQERFSGAIPSGAWANQFSIICWPITHAILPRDLQRQLAQVLYDLRHLFSAEFFESPLTLGESIAARSWNSTSRFQNLVQDPKLVGQIAAALLLQGEFGTGSLIHAGTLKRISQDLERERQARHWLRGARRIAQERAKVRGLAFGGHRIFKVGQVEEARAQVVDLGIEPRVVLTPADTNKGVWQVWLEIPDLTHLLLKFPAAKDALTNSRCVVTGASGAPLARGRCLYGTNRVKMGRWPRTDETLLRFERADAHLQFLLRTECLLRPGDIRLLRIASDGLAYESRSLGVRPGQSYVVASTRVGFDDNEYLRPVQLGCDGVHGTLLELPNALTDDWENLLQRIGLGQSKSIEVWPAGLGAVVWDGEGYGEWLASERPCLGVCTDHPVHSLVIALDGSTVDALELSPVEPGTPMFVELPALPVGMHTVRVSSRTDSTVRASALGDLNVVMRVREVLPWSPGVTPQGPLAFQIDPSTPSLEQLWERRVQLTIQGPSCRHVRCKVSLVDNDADHPLHSRTLPSLVFPVGPDQWTAHFERHFASQKQAASAYDIARKCVIEFRADELGGFTVEFDREFVPLRWTLRRESGRYMARLYDDTGDDTKPQVVRVAYETPVVEERLELASRYEIPCTGGMYLARTPGKLAAILTPPTNVGLENLRCEPRIDAPARSLTALQTALTALEDWGNARLPGDFLVKRRRFDVLRALTRHVFGLLGGSNWFQAEEGMRSSRRDLGAFVNAISRRREEDAIGVALERDGTILAESELAERVARFGELVRKYLPIHDKAEAHWYGEFALRLASSPIDLRTWAGEQYENGISYLFMDQTTLARAARYLVLVVDQFLESQTTGSELYAGWDWSWSV